MIKNLSSYGINLSGAGATVEIGNYDKDSAINSEGTAIKYQVNESEELEQSISLYNTKISNNNGNLVQVGGAELINNKEDQVLSASLNLFSSELESKEEGLLFGIENNSNININSDKTNLFGNIEVTDNSFANINLQNNSHLKSGINKITQKGNTDLVMNDSQWSILDNSWIRNLEIDNSRVTFQNSANTLVLDGDFRGNNSIITFNTNLGDDTSETNTLHIKGNATGNSLLDIINNNGMGAETRDGIKLVQIDGTSDVKFSLLKELQVGIYEYHLYEGTPTENNSNWYLRHYYTPTPVEPPVVEPPVDPEIPIEPTVPEEVKPVTPDAKPITTYRPGVMGYLTAQKANIQQGLEEVGYYQERISNQERKINNNLWGRVTTTHTNESGETRNNYKQQSSKVQIGKDMYESSNGDIVGVMATYSWANIGLSDLLKISRDKSTGKSLSQAVNLGGYYTKIDDNGNYVDFVGMIGHINNKYTDVYGETSRQNGYRLTLSTEVGKSFHLKNNFLIEPQAQIIYMGTKYEGFSDNYSRIEEKVNNVIIGRTGLTVRKYFDSEKDNQLYLNVNLLRNIKGYKTSLNIDNNLMEESYDKSIWEIGIGGNVKVSDTVDMYGNAKYQNSFDNNMKNISFNIGITKRF